ncbi:MAG: class I SAM-dependent methyltransferase [Clostridia bacterium]|nr:class I SAM-dependent methyltransferase [Clostridia bacterium]
MDTIQTFYNELAPHYEKLFLDWSKAVSEQADIIDKILAREGLFRDSRLLDCACGIGTQAIGLASLGYSVTASDISEGALFEAKKRSAAAKTEVRFLQADFKRLDAVFSGKFDAVLAMDNALPHEITADGLFAALKSIASAVRDGGLFIASIRDYDELIKTKPPYSPPYIHEADGEKRLSFQTWKWEGDVYRLTQYIIEDGATLSVKKFDCVYRAVSRRELSKLLLKSGFKEVKWLFPKETGFYQPIVIARKR